MVGNTVPAFPTTCHTKISGSFTSKESVAGYYVAVQNPLLIYSTFGIVYSQYSTWPCRLGMTLNSTTPRRDHAWIGCATVAEIKTNNCNHFCCNDMSNLSHFMFIGVHVCYTFATLCANARKRK
eukprot:5856015-Amphidinium_carterae.1